jgi:PilZ domain
MFGEALRAFASFLPLAWWLILRLLVYFRNLSANTPSRCCVGMAFSPDKNRRQSHRQWVSVPVLIRSRGSRIDGHSINISEGGMYLFAAVHLPPGSMIDIEFRPPDGKELVRTTGAVRRRALYLYGIEFLSDHAAATGDSTSVHTDNPIASVSP